MDTPYDPTRIHDHPLEKHIGKVIQDVRAYETPGGDRLVIEFLGGQKADLRPYKGKLYCS